MIRTVRQDNMRSSRVPVAGIKRERYPYYVCSLMSNGDELSTAWSSRFALGDGTIRRALCSGMGATIHCTNDSILLLGLLGLHLTFLSPLSLLKGIPFLPCVYPSLLDISYVTS